MQPKSLTPMLAADGQIALADLPGLAKQGFRAVICNRPDGETADQPTFAEIAAAAREAGLEALHLPVVSGRVSDTQAAEFAAALARLPAPVLAYCRTGTRSATLWALAEAAQGTPAHGILGDAKRAGYDLSGVTRRIVNGGRAPQVAADASHTVVIIGGGAAGVAVAASLKARDRDLDIALIDPAEAHYCRPGWTFVGAGVFGAETTARTKGSLIPRGVRWIKAAVMAFEPDRRAVIIDGCRIVTYQALVVAPGLKLDWNGIEGLADTIGRNGVTSNYRYGLAPCTWELVKGLDGGRAVFTQPPMPIKCAGAPQKAMYISADHWLRSGRLDRVSIEFRSAGAVLFGVMDYGPALMRYVERDRAQLHFGQTLTRIDGAARRAWFTRADAAPGTAPEEVAFDMIHVVPPQAAPDFVRASPLADAQGWVDVDQGTLRHRTFPGVYGLGDACNAPNAKTAAAARKQAPVVAHNLLIDLGALKASEASYDGYGSCPLTVERGKIVLAEFGYGGKLLPSFPSWLLDGTQPSHLAGLLKERMLPPTYWRAMLRGREWMARPEMRSDIAA